MCVHFRCFEHVEWSLGTLIARKGQRLLQLNCSFSLPLQRRWFLVVERRSQSRGSYCHGKSSQDDWILSWKFDEWQDLWPESSIGEDANGERINLQLMYVVSILLSQASSKRTSLFDRCHRVCTQACPQAGGLRQAIKFVSGVRRSCRILKRTQSKRASQLCWLLSTRLCSLDTSAMSRHISRSDRSTKTAKTPCTGALRASRRQPPA